MNKKVSKTLAAVLSAAMAASAFAVSTGAAFAANSATANTVNTASKSVAITTDTQGRSDYNLVNTNADLDGSYASLFTIVYQGHSYTANGISFAKGYTWEPADAASERLVSVTPNGDVRVKNPNVSNRQVATVRRKVNISATGEVGKHGQMQTINAEAYLTVELYIYPDDGYAVLPEDNVNKDGTPISNSYTVSFNEPANYGVFKIGTNSRTGEATFTNVDTDWSVQFSSSNSNIPVDANTGVVKAQPASDVYTGTATIGAKIWHTQADNTTVVPAQITVEDSYQVSGDEVTEVEKKYNTPTTTYLTSDLDWDLGYNNVGGKNLTQSDNKYNVTDKKIVMGEDHDDTYFDNNNNTTLILTDDSEVGNIVKDPLIPAGKTTTVYVEGQTGDISVDTVNVDTIHATYMWDGKERTLRDQDNDEPVKTGNITAKTIKVEGTRAASTQEGAYLTTTTGDLNGTNITISSTEGMRDNKWYAQGAVKTGDITVSDTLTLDAGEHVSAVSVGEIQGVPEGEFDDCPYPSKLVVNKGYFTLGDLKYIGQVVIGQWHGAANVTTGAIDTGNHEWKTSRSELYVNAESTLDADSIKIYTADPKSEGTIIVPENSMEITHAYAQEPTDAVLIVKDAKPGSVLYKAAGEINNKFATLFRTPGVTAVDPVKTDNNVWEYRVASTSFQGITLNTTAATVGQSPITLTASTLPTSVNTLPKGYHLEWTATGNSVELTPSADTMSCTVRATGYTANNINGSNNVTVTATVVDKDGNMIDTTVNSFVAVPAVSAQLTLTDAAPEKPLTGISLSATSMRVAPEQSKQLTVNFTPADADGDKTVTWTSSDESVATVDAEGNVTGVKVGTATITATCGDFTATCEVTVSENPFFVTVTNAEGEKITCAADGSTVIEVPQSMAFNFDISSEEEMADFDYTVGNYKVGGTNTNAVWNGTSGSYQIYAAGAVGSETGAYINGVKIFTLRVTDRPFTSDTTLNMNISRGQTYQFAITPDDPNASFTFLTANGEALSTSYNKAVYPDATGTYYCKVTANAVNQDVGVYCVIDGKTYKVFTAHLVG
mgnify:CR=1 FL=1